MAISFKSRHRDHAGANETGQVAHWQQGVFRNDSKKFHHPPADVVLVNSTSNNISVLLGMPTVQARADGTFTELGLPYSSRHEPSSVIVADFNGDGFLDLAVAIKVTIPYLFSGEMEMERLRNFLAHPSSCRIPARSGVQTRFAMVSANFRIKTLQPIRTAAPRKWTSQL